MVDEDNFYKKIGNLTLTNNQIEILNKNGIDITNFKSNHELIFYLESILNNVINEELDNLSLELSEIYYYGEINK